MDKEALKALKASIKKWEHNVRARKPENVKLGPTECPLCRLYSDGWCAGCPVEQRTSSPACIGTPYGEADNAQYKWEQGKGTREQFRAAAQAEVDFLRSLLPEGEVA